MLQTLQSSVHLLQINKTMHYITNRKWEAKREKKDLQYIFVSLTIGMKKCIQDKQSHKNGFIK